MSVTNSELYEALCTIQEMYREHTTCVTCPLYSGKDEDFCSLSYDSQQPPADWQLNEPNVYRAIS